MSKISIKNDSSLVAGQMQPTNMSVALSVTDLYYNVLAQVEQYAMNSSIFIPGNVTTDVVTPANFALYLYGMTYSHINKFGNLSGANKNDVCMKPERYAIPTGFAKYLEHLSPFTSGEATIKTSADLSAPLITVSAWFGTNIPEHFWGAAPLNWTPVPPAIQFGLVTQTGGVLNEFAFVGTGQNTTLADLWGLTASTISEAIITAGLSCTLYENVPSEAPNASAYSFPVDGTTGGPAPSSLSGAMWSNFSQKYWPEESNVFATFRQGGYAYGPMFTKGIVRCSPTLLYDTTIPTLTKMPGPVSSHFFNAWIGTRQNSYVKGPILKSYVLCKTKVKSLCYTQQTLDIASLHRVAYSALNEYLRQITATITDLELTRLIYLYLQVLTQCVISRINQSSPFHNLVLSNRSTSVAVPTIFSPQSGYVSRAWLSVSLPAVLARFVDAIGPINVNGVVTVPVIPSQSSVTFVNYSDGTVYPIASIGNSLSISGTNNTTTLCNTGLVALGGVVSPAFAPDGAVVTAASLQAYYTNGNAHLRAMFWNNNIEYFTSLFDRLHKKFFTGVGMSSSLIHMHNPPCGSLAMCSSASQGLATDVTSTPPLDMGAGFSATWQDNQCLSVLSYVNLPADEIVEVAMFRHITTDNTVIPDSTVGRYRYALPTSSASSQMIQSYATKTFSPQSSFSLAIAAKEAKFDPVKMNVGGLDIVSSDEDEGCWIRDLLKTVGRETFGALRYATPTAAGLVCGYFSPLASPFCASAASKIVDTVGSLAGIEADGYNVKAKDLKKVKKPRVAVPAMRMPQKNYPRKMVVKKPKASKAKTSTSGGGKLKAAKK